ncbi:hypothetical protein A3A40_00595 [Candidatus Kaiserbacteria bacterium RIFCSPLOWO2_01_FULL_54_20]|uniref:Transcription regulator TrmB N-terminal domain-containing protein n=1 Tax=Candidatus Kaiserbacteria bacterium RIFCSPLOWO2_01_FULL_54_20 TaxID=1798513 RepID=A0A1F6EJV1_9BACT|nr:MAG: hypothetical protein A3A40_00595 [Candidatus Kaiserbacteria bacterium RIFCSPLOWO2_01_FULL_54_20]
MHALSEDALQQLGLTRNEGLVYLALLKLKSALAGEITAKSGIHRRNVYDSLERLEEKGLVSFTVKNNRRFFQPAPPQRLLELAREKEDKVEKALPELAALFGSASARESVIVYSGVQGYKTLFEDILSTLPENSEWQSIASYRIAKIIPAFMEFMHKKRTRKKISFRVIYNNDEYGSFRAREVSGIPLTKVRLMQMSNQTPAGINVFGKKCAIGLVTDTDEPIIIVINNESIAKTFGNFFEVLWKQAKPLGKA